MRFKQHLATLKYTLHNTLKEKAEGKRTDFFTDGKPFQKDSGNTTGQLMLSAPTGSGKTEAALLWSDKKSM